MDLFRNYIPYNPHVVFAIVPRGDASFVCNRNGWPSKAEKRRDTCSSVLKQQRTAELTCQELGALPDHLAGKMENKYPLQMMKLMNE